MTYREKFKSPTDLLLDESLSHDEKREMLEKWRDDENALLRASEEGMQGDDHPNDLKEVEKALNTLLKAPTRQ